MKKLYYDILHKLHIKRYKYSAGKCKTCSVPMKMLYTHKMYLKERFGFCYCRNGHKNYIE